MPSADRLRWIRGFDRITGVGFALYPPARDASFAVAFELVYPDAGSARDAAEDLSRLIANGSLRRLAGDGREDDAIVGVESVGSVLVVRAVGRPALTPPVAPPPPL